MRKRCGSRGLSHSPLRTKIPEVTTLVTSKPCCQLKTRVVQLSNAAFFFFLSPLDFLTEISWTRGISISPPTFYIKFEGTFLLASCWKRYRVLNVNLKSACIFPFLKKSHRVSAPYRRKEGKLREPVTDTRQSFSSLTSWGAPLESRATKN